VPRAAVRRDASRGVAQQAPGQQPPTYLPPRRCCTNTLCRAQSAFVRQSRAEVFGRGSSHVSEKNRMQ
jgi:hypothetical protein